MVYVTMRLLVHDYRGRQSEKENRDALRECEFSDGLMVCGVQSTEREI